MSKKVIFVGGTSYSGSTMLDMILSNDPTGYSLGEIFAIFRPSKRHHFEEIKNLRSDNNWNKILKKGEKKLFKNLFEINDNIEYFVDSSKDTLWITKHSGILRKNNISVKNILIYKSPQELAHSFAKRNKLDEFESNMINYYKGYLYHIKEFRSVSYKQIVRDKSTLKLLCNYLGIDYFPEKEEFWQKEHHTFFGNNRARVHTGNLKPRDYNGSQNLTKEGKQRLYYVEPDNPELIEIGDKLEKKYRDIFNYIYSRNILSENTEISYHYSKFEMKKKLIYSVSKNAFNSINAKFNFIANK